VKASGERKYSDDNPNSKRNFAKESSLFALLLPCGGQEIGDVAPTAHSEPGRDSLAAVAAVHEVMVGSLVLSMHSCWGMGGS
jgi:hypothetical protein